jgi:phosphoglycolate phosphatase
VVETLEKLHECGVRMAVLTNKPERFSRDLCAGLGLAQYFFRIYGGNSFEQKKPDPVGIRTLMQQARAKPQETWMVGDSATDVLTARNAGVRAVGVTYGISPETLKQAPPDFLIDSMTQLPPILGLK